MFYILKSTNNIPIYPLMVQLFKDILQFYYSQTLRVYDVFSDYKKVFSGGVPFGRAFRTQSFLISVYTSWKKDFKQILQSLTQWAQIL